MNEPISIKLWAILRSPIVEKGETIYDGEPKKVTITNQRDHHIWGRQYQVRGYGDRWFEANCFSDIYQAYPIEQQKGETE
jgi:hypothetical protein